MHTTTALDVLIIGGGMITYDQILPSVYHLQRQGVVGRIGICGRRSAPLRELAESQPLREAFPGQTFDAYPPLTAPDSAKFPRLFEERLAALPPRQCVIAAVPDQEHYDVVMACLRHDQHVLCVKPLVLKYTQALEIEHLAREKGLFVGVEYHKRFDRRSLLARKEYRLGHVGEFVMAEARLIEPYYYRHSNFQNWFTCDQTDPFVYIGCHYVDLLVFVTGLMPSAVSVAGVKGKFPNGKEGYMWTAGRVTFENGAILSIVNGLGYPDLGAGSNEQGLIMYCEGDDKSGLIEHDDQFRGVHYSFTTAKGPGGSEYNYVNPDYMKLVAWEGTGYKPVGYGYDSVAANVEAIARIVKDTGGMTEAEALVRRRALLADIDDRGIIATPKNSSYNELVQEAARLSILNDGRTADIHWGAAPSVSLRA